MNNLLQPLFANLEDNEIQEEVKNKIKTNPNIPYADSNRISVRVKSGVVTLMGNVKRFISKPLAYIDAFSVHGVTAVNNNIEIAG